MRRSDIGGTAFYTRKIAAAIVYLIIDFFNLLLAVVGIGVITGLLFRLIAGLLAYNWARAINNGELERAISSRKAQATESV